MYRLPRNAFFAPKEAQAHPDFSTPEISILTLIAIPPDAPSQTVFPSIVVIALCGWVGVHL